MINLNVQIGLLSVSLFNLEFPKIIVPLQRNKRDLGKLCETIQNKKNPGKSVTRQTHQSSNQDKVGKQNKQKEIIDLDKYESDFIDDSNANGNNFNQKQTDNFVSKTIKNIYGYNKQDFNWKGKN